MKIVRDGSDDTRSRRRLDDATAEALVAGDARAGADDLSGVSAFLEELRALREGPPPPPCAALARMLAGEPEPPAGSFLRSAGDDEGDGASEALSRQGEPFDPGDGDRAAVPPR